MIMLGFIFKKLLSFLLHSFYMPWSPHVCADASECYRTIQRFLR